MSYAAVRKVLPELADLLEKEDKRQRETIELIPSENFASGAVRLAQASRFMNKYAEGYPGSRYYPGNEVVDEVERLAQKLAREAFGLDTALWAVNVQPYSGSPGNLAVYLGLMKPDDTLLGMRLDHGGHLTHGYRVSATGIFWHSVQYGLNPATELIDYDALEQLAAAHTPKVIVSGATAYSRIIDFARFGSIAREHGAFHLADISHIAGLIAAGEHPSPFPHADVVMTTTHKTLRGPRAAVIFARKDRFVEGKSDRRSSIAECIDRAVFPGLQGGPHEHTIAAMAVAFAEALTPKFKRYQKQVRKNAAVLAEALAQYGFRLVGGKTENHLLLIDLKPKNISGKDAEHLLERANIIANRNSVIGDEKPFHPSGIRMGTPALTSRGLKEREMRKIAGWVHELIDDRRNPEEVRKVVVAWITKYPLP